MTYGLSRSSSLIAPKPDGGLARSYSVHDLHLPAYTAPNYAPLYVNSHPRKYWSDPMYQPYFNTSSYYSRLQTVQPNYWFAWPYSYSWRRSYRHSYWPSTFLNTRRYWAPCSTFEYINVHPCLY
ncbi:hypothetical protein M3Y97_00884400 [Aphelenchoides bicaudatus]|nr:hypothetical protein M3Y97_00884400 [Aphelenchoides bicaudatus]